MKTLQPFFVNLPRDVGVNEKIVLLLDESRGIYIPKAFYDGFDFATWGLNISKYRDLSDPANDVYWDAWHDLLCTAEYHAAPTPGKAIGHVWTLYQDGSLFAVRDDYLWGSADENT
jgi:hypothetical protein